MDSLSTAYELLQSVFVMETPRFVCFRFFTFGFVLSHFEFWFERNFFGLAYKIIACEMSNPWKNEGKTNC